MNKLKISQRKARTESIEVNLEQLIACQHLAKDKIPLPNKKTKAHLVGGHLSPFKGRGMEFSEVRQYQPGDDIRSIDWRVTARTGKPHTKIFQEERERPVFLLLDLQDSMFFGSRNRFKSTQACLQAARAFWSAFNSGNRVGALLSTAEQHIEIKPSNRRKDGLRLLQKMLEMHNQRLEQIYQQTNYYQLNKNSLADSLLRLCHLAKGGSLVYIFSDFFNLDKQCEKYLAQLSQFNDIYGVMLSDPLEKDIPIAGQYHLTDGTNKVSLDSRNTKSISQYRLASNQRYAKVQQQFSDRKCYFAESSTEQAITDLSLNPQQNKYYSANTSQSQDF